jgi:hypothetical protein
MVVLVREKGRRLGHEQRAEPDGNRPEHRPVGVPAPVEHDRRADDDRGGDDGHRLTDAGGDGEAEVGPAPSRRTGSAVLRSGDEPVEQGRMARGYSTHVVSSPINSGA